MDRTIPGAAEGQWASASREVARLMGAGKCKQAVELAKTEHKRLNTAASEKLLVDAYLARIEQFQNKGATQDAQTLLNLVRQRFPAHQAELGDLSLKSAAAEGNIEALVAPLGRGDASPEQRTLIETALRRNLTDLPRLANCATLPAGHALRSAAAAIWGAFSAVSAGPVTDAQIALAEVSRHSPLADWKLLIRGMAAFYRGEDGPCRRNLTAIAEDSVVRRIANVLLAAVDHSPPAPGRAGALQARVAGDDKALRRALDRLETALNSRYLDTLTSAMRAALEACSASHPELLDNLRQRISVRCAMEEVPVREVLKVMGPARKDSIFWRLLARSAEMQQTPLAAAAFWDRFRRHAIQEGAFAGGSMEEAAVHLHAARLLAEAYSRRSADPRLFHHIRDYYKNQPEEIAALEPKVQSEVDEATEAHHLFRRAVEIDPHAPAFVQWYAWAQASRLPARQLQELAELWHRKLPAEPKPLLILSQLAEDRKALKLALNYLSQAEARDPMNPAARKARVRLTLSTAWKHFLDRKPHLVQQDLEALAALPAMSEEDRPALLEAMRAAWHAIAGASSAAQAAADRMARLAGPVMAPHLLESVKDLIRYSHDLPPLLPEPALLQPLEVAEAESRIIRLNRDTLVPIYRPKSWTPLIAEVLEQEPCPLSQAALRDIAFGAITMQDWEVAYRATAAGLSGASGSNAGWFLLRRAQSVTKWSGRRAAQCLRAALELSRQGHDPELAANISDVVEQVPEAQAALDAAAGRALGSELLEEVLNSERKARKYPRNQAEAERYVVALAVPQPFNPFEDDDQASELDDGPFDDADLPELPPGVSPEILEEAFRGSGMPLPKPGEGLDPKLIGKMAAILADLLTAESEPDEEQGSRGFLPRLFGRRKKKNRR